MVGKLLNEKEAAAYLGISEARLKELVEAKEISAYKIAGQFLRFNQQELDDLKRKSRVAQKPSRKNYPFQDRVLDALYYNDFYIIVIILIVMLLALIFKVSF